MLPAEWEPQKATLLAWPHDETDWNPILERVWVDYAVFITTILRFQEVWLLTADIKQTKTYLSTFIKEHNSKINYPLRFLPFKTNDTWCRDFGPIAHRNKDGLRYFNFIFNGWGNKYKSILDNGVNDYLAETEKVRMLLNSDLVLEGGSIESNGKSLILTTSQCLSEKNRNPNKGLKQIVGEIENIFNATVYPLQNGYLQNDDTDGHIDTLVRFLNEKTVVYVAPPKDSEHANYTSLEAMKKELEWFSVHNQLKLVPLPNADFIYKGERYPATYANFLFVNGALLVPQYNLDTDQEALTILKKHCKGREIIGIPSHNFILQGGSLHCLSMQLFKEGK